MCLQQAHQHHGRVSWTTAPHWGPHLLSPQLSVHLASQPSVLALLCVVGSPAPWLPSARPSLAAGQVGSGGK